MTLLERAAQLDLLTTRLGEVQERSRGRFVLVAGEAGIGKTALVRTFCEGRPRVLWGACDALYTPRPLGPLVDIAEEAGGELAALVAEGATPGALAAALAAELRRPAIVVLEDLHWADEATLDVVRLLARRIETLPALVIATYRDDELDRAHPLRMVLGALPSRIADRVAPPPLSPEAVAELAPDVDHAELHRRTGGNAFFVTEALAAGGADLPATVRDAVLARAARLDPAARALLDAVAIVPLRTELWLLEALTDTGALDACLASGMLRADRDAIAFRHEIARVAVEEALSPIERRRLHRRALTALAAAANPDLARLAHHAEAAGDAEAVLRYAPAAGERAAKLGSHREAAAQFARALRYEQRRRPARAALVRVLPDRPDRGRDRGPPGGARARIDRSAAPGRRAPLALAAGLVQRRQRDRRARGVARGRAARAARSRPRAGDGLQQPGPVADARVRRAGSDRVGRASDRARRAARRHRDPRPRAQQRRCGARCSAARPDGRGTAASRASSWRSTRASRNTSHARTRTSGRGLLDVRELAPAERYLDAGIDYCAEHDLDSWLLYMSGYRARLSLERGDWDAAADTATTVLAHPGAAVPTRITPLVVIGRLRARRGDPAPCRAARRGAGAGARHRRGAADRASGRRARRGALARGHERRDRRRDLGRAGARRRRPVAGRRAQHLAPSGRDRRRDRA